MDVGGHTRSWGSKRHNSYKVATRDNTAPPDVSESYVNSAPVSRAPSGRHQIKIPDSSYPPQPYAHGQTSQPVYTTYEPPLIDNNQDAYFHPVQQPIKQHQQQHLLGPNLNPNLSRSAASLRRDLDDANYAFNNSNPQRSKSQSNLLYPSNPYNVQQQRNSGPEAGYPSYHVSNSRPVSQEPVVPTKSKIPYNRANTIKLSRSAKVPLQQGIAPAQFVGDFTDHSDELPEQPVLPQNEFFGSSRRSFDNHREEHVLRGTLYEDPEFPANDLSLYFSRQPHYKFQWLRPHEIAGQYGLQPELFVENSKGFDLIQGELGDVWLTATLASLSENMELIYRVVPRGQSFQPGWYGGLFKFLFWRYGMWEEVIIDDRLPTVDGRLLFIHSGSPNEFWGALLEKAYAKLHGSYEALKGGLIADALHDVTGGLVESYRLQPEEEGPSKNLINILFKALERQSLVNCGIQPSEHQNTPLLPSGLVAGQAYNVTDLREIRIVSDRGEIPVTLVRVRNPWGNPVEWNGPWSLRSPEWNNINKFDRQSMGLVSRDDGEFWMDMRDFMQHFHTLDICNLTPDSPLRTNNRWKVDTYYGRWSNSVCAGGRPVCKLHWTNQQYKVILKERDEDDNQCTVIVELMQRDRRRLRQRGMTTVDVGFLIYKPEKGYTLPLNEKFFERHKYVDRCDFYTNSRQICKRFLFPMGEYVIVPTTYDPNTEASFMIRTFFEKDSKMEPAEPRTDLVDVGKVPTDPRRQEREGYFKHTFYELSGEDMEVNAFEFHKLMNEALQTEPNYREISIDSSKILVSLVDLDEAGKAGYYEFLYVLGCVRSWMKTFTYFDQDNIGAVNAFDLRTMLPALGYHVTTSMVRSLVFRYSDENQMIELDAFIQCMAKMQKIHNIFKEKHKNTKVHFTLERLLEATLVL